MTTKVSHLILASFAKTTLRNKGELPSAILSVQQIFKDAINAAQRNITEITEMQVPLSNESEGAHSIQLGTKRNFDDIDSSQNEVTTCHITKKQRIQEGPGYTMYLMCNFCEKLMHLDEKESHDSSHYNRR